MLAWSEGLGERVEVDFEAEFPVLPGAPDVDAASALKKELLVEAKVVRVEPIAVR